MQRVEGVKELLLSSVLSCQELDVVDQEHVDRPVPRPEVVHPVLLDGGDHLVHELLAGHVRDLGRPVHVAFADGMADRVHQVRLAQADASVEEERVVGLSGGVGDGAAGGVGEAAAVAHHEGGEGEVGIETGDAAALEVGVDAVGEQRGVGGFVVGKRRRLVRRRCRRGIDGDGDLALERGQLGQGLADERHVSLGQPVTSQACGHTDGEQASFGALEEDGVAQPRLVAGAGELKAELLLGRLPDLLGFHRHDLSPGPCLEVGHNPSPS